MFPKLLLTQVDDVLELEESTEPQRTVKDHGV